MSRKALGVLLLAALVGVVAGVGLGYLSQPRPGSGGAATPLPAVAPSVPVDEPVTPAPYDPDIDYPPLASGLRFGDIPMGNSVQAWRVPVPVGWQAYDLDDVPVPAKQRPTYDELRFRPPDEPTEGGYSLRVKTVNDHVSTGSMVTDKLVKLRELDDVSVLGRTEDSLKITYRDGNNHLRYNYFQWFAAPGSGEATLEMSVAGRSVDEPGLSDLFAAFASTLRPA